jgi:hypothetical protein
MKSQPIHCRFNGQLIPKYLGWCLLAAFFCMATTHLTGQNAIHVRNCTEKIITLSCYNAWDNSMSIVYQGKGTGRVSIPQIHSILAENGGKGETGEVNCAERFLWHSSSSCKVKFECATGYDCPTVTKTLESGNYVYFNSTLIEKGDVCYQIGAEPDEFVDSRPVRSGEKIYASDGPVRLLEAGYFALIMQKDGSLVIQYLDPYSGPHKIWSSRTAGFLDPYLGFQSDGNLVIYCANNALWATGTSDGQNGGLGGVRLELTGTGILRIKNAAGKVIWKTG